MPITDKTKAVQDANEANTNQAGGATQENQEREKPERVQILFDGAAMNTIDQLKARYRAGSPSTAGLIRDALGFYAWAADELTEGKKIVAVDRNGTQREIYLPFK